jgi:hypothetical protein
MMDFPASHVWLPEGSYIEFYLVGDVSNKMIWFVVFPVELLG